MTTSYRFKALTEKTHYSKLKISKPYIRPIICGSLRGTNKPKPKKTENIQSRTNLLQINEINDKHESFEEMVIKNFETIDERITGLTEGISEGIKELSDLIGKGFNKMEKLLDKLLIRTFIRKNKKELLVNANSNSVKSQKIIRRKYFNIQPQKVERKKNSIRRKYLNEKK